VSNLETSVASLILPSPFPSQRAMNSPFCAPTYTVPSESIVDAVQGPGQHMLRMELFKRINAPSSSPPQATRLCTGPFHIHWEVPDSASKAYMSNGIGSDRQKRIWLSPNQILK